MQIRIILSVAFSIFATFFSYSQYHEFGSLTDWEKNFSLSTPNKEFDAVFLYEKGDVYFEVIDNKILMLKKYHAKIKVLNRKGFDRANIVIPFYFVGESSEKIKDIRAMTHNGEVKQKITQDKIYKVDKDSDTREMRFTFPNVQIGSILEYEYTLTSPFYFKLEGWSFQGYIPKAYSEFNAKIPRSFLYNRSLIGSLKLDTDESYIQNNCFVLPDPWDAADCEVLTYAMRDIPPFEKENFMLSPKNFISRLEFELSEYFTINRIRKKYTKSWKDVDRDYKNEDFGKELSKSSFFKNNLPKELLNETESLSKAIGVYMFVQEHYIWNGNYNIHKTIDVKEAFDRKNGNIAEINVSLINFLKAAGIDAYPMLISTRNNGLPKKEHPVIYDFNYLIVKVKINDKEYLLDASEKITPFGMLPFRCLNYYGRVMDFKKGSYWQNIKSEKKNSVTYRVQLKLDPNENKVFGIFDEINLGYFAIDKRRLLKSANSEIGYLEEKQEKLGDYLKITSYKLFKERNHNKLVSERFGFEIEDVLNNETIYLNPFLTKFFEKNPFQLTNRSYPVDFGYVRNYNYQVNIDVPENYTVRSLPKKIAIDLEGNLGSLKLDHQISGNKILISLNVNLNSSFFPPEAYNALKEMLVKVIGAQSNSLIVFEKK